MWAERITESAVAHQAIAGGFSNQSELAGLADGWRDWSASPDGWFAVLNAEVLCRVE
jgi:hypothetical protein